MSQIPSAPIMVENSTVLPKSHILSYVTSVNTPTRLRKLTARFLWIIGGFHLFGAVMGIVLLTYIISVAAREYYKWGGTLVLVDYIRCYAIDRGWLIPFLLIVYALSCGVTLCCCGKPVRNGRRIACFFSKVALLPSVVILLLLATATAGQAIYFGLGIEESRARPVYFFMFIPTALCILLILLLGDLMGFLTWIGRNPVTEMPPVPFLPSVPTARVS